MEFTVLDGSCVSIGLTAGDCWMTGPRWFRGNITISALLCVLLTPCLGWSWGQVGHRASAMLAESCLTPAALAAVRGLLEPGENLADISVWADYQNEVEKSAPWHYVDVPISESRYLEKYCREEGCVVSKIEDFRRILLEPRKGRAEKQRALKFLVHLIQDMHQPLHVGDRNNQGGNQLQVRFFNTGSNLHLVWDFRVIERHSLDETLWMRELDALATPKMIAEWSTGTIIDWADESLECAKMAYRFPGTGKFIESGVKLDQAYCHFSLPIIQRRLAQSAVRVAFTLNSIFK